MTSPGNPNIPLGVVCADAPPPNKARGFVHADYIHEILGHAGLCYRSVEAGALAEALADLRVLVTVGEGAPEDALKDALGAWVEQGGTWIAIAGCWGMEPLFGVEVEPPAYAAFGTGVGTLGEGYLRSAAPEHPMCGALEVPLHFFNGTPVRAKDATVLANVLDAHGRPTERAGLTERTVGQGRAILIAPDVTGSVVRIQQGIGLTRDGIPAPDGTAPTSDGVLKTDDALQLDWILDRDVAPNADGFVGFLQPVADFWRELVLRGIFYAASEQGLALPLLWLYPRNLPAIGHVSHDTDGNVPEAAHKSLERVAEGGMKTTWCTICPGYGPEIIGAIRDAGHELAMHYDAMSKGKVWSEQEFHEQWLELKELFGGDEIITNKNHYLRWEGDCELWDWCLKRGIQLDESKGPSKAGAAGFTFGTSHPYFPVRPSGEVIDVIELATLTQDLNLMAPAGFRDVLLERVLRTYGVLHLLFHPAHIVKDPVGGIMVESARMAHERGMEWWTARAINAWERARRKARWADYAAKGKGASVRLQADAALDEATILWLLPTGATVLEGSSVQSLGKVERWGFTFEAAACSVSEGGEAALEVKCGS